MCIHSYGYRAARITPDDLGAKVVDHLISSIVVFYFSSFFFLAPFLFSMNSQ